MDRSLNDKYLLNIREGLIQGCAGADSHWLEEMNSTNLGILRVSC